MLPESAKIREFALKIMFRGASQTPNTRKKINQLFKDLASSRTRGTIGAILYLGWPKTVYILSSLAKLCAHVPPKKGEYAVLSNPDHIISSARMQD